MYEIVNIVGAGKLEQTLDLLSLYSDIEPPLAKYDPEMYHGMYLFSHKESSLTATVYSSGAYILIGAKTTEELSDGKCKLLNILSGCQSINDLESSQFTIENIVASGDLETELELNQVAVSLGLDNAEYDPDNFPAVVYPDNKNNCTVLVYRTGKIIITGATSFTAVEDAYADFVELLDN